jgi:hypothetical protein
MKNSSDTIGNRTRDLPVVAHCTSACPSFSSKQWVIREAVALYWLYYVYTAHDVSYTGELISPQPNLIPDVFCFMGRIFLLMLVLLYIYIVLIFLQL